VLPDVSPRNDRQDDDDQRATEDRLGHGLVHVTGRHRRYGHDGQPDQLPERLEQQDRQQPDGIPQPQEREE
jgi:hypothetical protein